MQVAGKVIVVTGGGSGIGRALVLGLVSEGARVAALDINEKTLHETHEMAGLGKEKISLHVANVGDKTSVDTLPEAIIDAHGSVDGLSERAKWQTHEQNGMLRSAHVPG